jgi:hypothetical protein
VQLRGYIDCTGDRAMNFNATAYEPGEWEQMYQSAKLETNILRLPQKIFDAEVAMFKRKLQLNLNEKGNAEHREIKAINEALAHLVVLRRQLDGNEGSTRPASGSSRQIL